MPELIPHIIELSEKDRTLICPYLTYLKKYCGYFGFDVNGVMSKSFEQEFHEISASAA
jgi:hypothetical protein